MYRKFDTIGEREKGYQDIKPFSYIISYRQGLRSFAGMCQRQEDLHRGSARDISNHLVFR